MGHLTGPGTHAPPSCTLVPIPQAKRLSLRRDGAISCAQRGASGKQDREALHPNPGSFPIPGRVVKGRYDTSLLPSTIPAVWFALRVPSGLSGSALRPPEFPRVQGRWYSPWAPLVSGSLPLPLVPMRRGPTTTVPGPGDSGLSPALPALQARRHLVAAPGFRSGKCESD